jgi:hypothetical protein
LSEEEKAEIAATGKFWHTQITFGHPFQPMRLSTQNPFEEVVSRPISPIAALVPALINDPVYRESWKANIAMAFKDIWDSWDFHKFPTGTVKGKELVPSIHELAIKAADNFLYMLCLNGEMKKA